MLEFNCSMDGFRIVKLSEVVRSVDIVITCTGNWLVLVNCIWQNQHHCLQIT